MIIKNVINIVVAVAVLVIVTVVTGAVYVVPETKQVVVTQFGRPVSGTYH